MKTTLNLAALGIFLLTAAVGCQPKTSQTAETGSAPVSDNEWQALYLTSGQVYYGRLTDEKGQFFKLADVYTIQMAPAGQDKAKSPSRPTLVKVGNELVGSVDEISVNREHILFIQNLKKEAQVVQGILRLKAQASAPRPAAAPAAETKPAPKK